jgi:hypothetical protein
MVRGARPLATRKGPWRGRPGAHPVRQLPLRPASWQPGRALRAPRQRCECTPGAPWFGRTGSYPAGGSRPPPLSWWNTLACQAGMPGDMRGSHPLLQRLVHKFDACPDSILVYRARPFRPSAGPRVDPHSYLIRNWHRRLLLLAWDGEGVPAARCSCSLPLRRGAHRGPFVFVRGAVRAPRELVAAAHHAPFVAGATQARRDLAAMPA